MKLLLGHLYGSPLLSKPNIGGARGHMGVFPHSGWQHRGSCIEGNQEACSFENDSGTLHVPLEVTQGDGGQPIAQNCQHRLLHRHRNKSVKGMCVLHGSMESGSSF